jgi:voltage-dependent anion channel protein 2
MSPPAYSDLGKNARDLFGKGYHFGLWKLDLKTKTDSGVEFTTAGHSNQDDGKVFGSLETKYKVKEYGLTFSEKWSTNNTLSSEVAVENQLVKGLKLSLDGSFAPQNGSKSGKFKAAYSHERVRLDGDVNLDFSPIVNASAVVGYQGWLAGYQFGFNCKDNKIVNNNFALGYTTGDFVLHTSVNDGKVFGGSIYQRCNDRLETGVDLSWSTQADKGKQKFGIAAKYALDKDASVRAKVDIESKIGLGYQQKLRDGITLTLSSQIDAKNFNSGGHKVGCALELEA